MSMRYWAPVVALALSCHSPADAHNRAVAAPSDSSADTAGFSLDVFLEISAMHATGVTRRARVPGVDGVPTISDPDDPSKAEPAKVSLCCDQPSGLCFRDDGARCKAETSRLVECPAVAVRDFDAEREIVVCAD